MHRFRSGIVGMALAGVLAGCGGTTVDEGPKPFQSTDLKGANMEPMLKEMQEVAKKRDYTKKQVVPSEKEKTKDSEKK
jgi:hypothetical protein